MVKKEKKKSTNTTKKTMNIWAKISSALIIPLLIILIILIPGIFTESFSEGIKALFITIFIILFYFPLIYYAWFKKRDNNGMKIFAKITTILVSVLSIWSLVINKDSKTLIEVLTFYTPLFYYAWKE